MDLTGIYGAYRADGHGAAAYEPSMMGGADSTGRRNAQR